jgi:hypothetical protein
MECYHTGAAGHSVEECGNVRKPDQSLGPPGHGREIDAVEQAYRAIPAPNAPDCIYAGVPQCGVQIGESLIVGTSEVTVSGMGIFS